MFRKLTQGPWAVAALLLVTVLFLLNWKNVIFATAVASADRRPVLLSEAEWGKSNRQQAFGKRFHSGTPEIELLEWLQANGFRVDHAKRSAGVRLEGVPCAENVTVSWTAERQFLSQVDAVVTEGGCL